MAPHSALRRCRPRPETVVARRALHPGTAGIAGIALVLGLLAPPGLSRGESTATPAEPREVGPQLGPGLLELVRVPAWVAGDVIGGAGLLLAAGVATAGDGIALLDRNRVTQGWVSAGVHRLAQGASWLGTQALERLRCEDVERFPEAPATYLEAMPFTGRLDTALSGAGAIRVGVNDLLLGPMGALARMAGASEIATDLGERRRESALYHLGPPPLPTPESP